MPKDHCWALLNKTSGGCLNSDGEPRDGAKMIGTPSPMFFVIMLAVDHEPDHYRYVESTPGDLPLLKIGLQHLLAAERPVHHPVRRRQQRSC